MIIDCDTHLMPRDAFNAVGGALEHCKPTLKFDDQELYCDVDFPGYPSEVSGTSPLPAPGSGAMFRSLWDPIARMKDYDGRLGIDQQIVLPQFSGWWSYLIEPELACRMARSHNESLLRVMEEFAGKIFGSALVALQDVQTAIDEMEWAQDHGFCSVVLDKVFPVKGHPFGEPLGSHRELWPFFKRAEELSMPIYLHNVQHGHRLSNLAIFFEKHLRWSDRTCAPKALADLGQWTARIERIFLVIVIDGRTFEDFIEPLHQRFDE